MRKRLRRRLKKNRLLAISLVIILISSLGIASVGAYLIARDYLDNVTSIGYNSIEIEEAFVNPDIEVGETTIITKQVQVRNTGESSCYVRVKIAFSDESVLGYTDIDYNDSDWNYNSADDYWYYTRELSEESAENEHASITTPLFTSLSINNPTAEQVRNFDVYVYAESWTGDEVL